MPSVSQVDKLGVRLRTGEVTAQSLRDLEEYRSGFGPAYDHVELVLTGHLRQDVTGRPSKSTLAIIEKLKRESIRLSQIQDIAGCRIVTSDIASQNALCESARVLLGNVVVVDRRSKPVNGYRAIHLIAKVDNKPVEVQIRTRYQHAWAEISEKMSDIYGQEIKYGGGDAEAREFLGTLSKLTRELEALQVKRAAIASLPMSQARHTGVSRSRRKQFEAAQYAERLCIYKIRALFAGLSAR